MYTELTSPPIYVPFHSSTITIYPMKPFAWILGATLLLLGSACDREEPQPVDPVSLLPPATQTGENTLGFLLDGEPWTPNRLFQGQYRESDSAFLAACENVIFDENGQNSGQGFSIFIRKLTNTGNYILSMRIKG